MNCSTLSEWYCARTQTQTSFLDMGDETIDSHWYSAVYPNNELCIVRQVLDTKHNGKK